MLFQNNLTVPINMDFEDGRVIIPPGKALRVHIGLLAEPRVIFRPPVAGKECNMTFYWGRRKIRTEPVA